MTEYRYQNHHLFKLYRCIMSGPALPEVPTLDTISTRQYLHAYQECSDEVRELVQELFELISDPECDEEAKHTAESTLVEALFPGVTADLMDNDRTLMSLAETAPEYQELVAEEEAFRTSVKEIMDARGLTQGDLAELIGCSQPAVSNVLNRPCRPQMRTVKKFAVALGVEPIELWAEWQS